MDKADAGIDFAAQLFVLRGTRRDIAGEVVDGRDAMADMVEAAVQREPVLVVDRGEAALATANASPAAQELVHRQAAKGRLVDVAVGGDESRDDKFSRGVD